MVKVDHDPTGQKFYIGRDSEQGFLAYTHVNNILDLYFIFAADETQETADAMVTAAFEFAKKENCKIIPTSGYVQGFLKRNPQYLAYTEHDLTV